MRLQAGWCCLALMRCRAGWLCCLGCLGLVLLPACSGRPPPAPPPPTLLQADGPVDKPAIALLPAGDRLAVRVLSLSGNSWAGGWAGHGTPAALAGATVAADLPGGERLVGTTDAKGRVVFSAGRWSAGTASVTAHAAGHALTSRVGIRSPRDEVSLRLLTNQPRATEPVSGELLNLDPTATRVILGPTVYGERLERPAVSGPFELQAAHARRYSIIGVQLADEPGTALGEIRSEVHGWSRWDRAVGEPGFASLDFARPIASVNVRGSIVLPDAIGAARPGCWVGLRGRGALLGSCTRFAARASGERADTERAYTVEHITAAQIAAEDLDGVRTVYVAQLGEPAYGPRSEIIVEGYPRAAVRVEGFLRTPVLTWPASPAPIPRGSTIDWTNPEPSARVMLVSRRTDNGQLAWLLEGPPAMRSTSLPDPPPGAAGVLGTGTLVTRVLLGSSCDDDEPLCRRRAFSRPVFLQAANTRTVDVHGGFFALGHPQPVAGVEVCVKEHPAVPCATSCAGGLFSLAGVPDHQDVTLVARKTGYLPLELPRAARQPAGGYYHYLVSALALDALAAGIDRPLDPQAAMILAAADRPGVRFDLTPTSGCGPIYAGDDGLPDARQPATGQPALGWLVNLAAADYAITASLHGVPCAVHLGWRTEATVARVRATAGAVVAPSFSCD